MRTLCLLIAALSLLAGDGAFERGKKLYREKRYEKAIEALREAVDEDFTDARAFYYLALCHEKLGDIDQAMVHAESAADLADTDQDYAKRGRKLLDRLRREKKERAEREREKERRAEEKRRREGPIRTREDFDAAVAYYREGDRAQVGRIMRALRKSKSTRLRADIAEFLGEIETQEVVDLLLSVYRQSKKLYLRKKALESLVRIGKLSVAGLERSLKSKDTFLRENSARALGRIGRKSSVKPLVRLLSDDEIEVRLTVIEALVKLKAAEALPDLRKLAEKDPYEDVRAAARDAVKKLSGK